MRGELRFVIDSAMTEVWEPLLNHPDCPDNPLGDVYVAMAGFMLEPRPDVVKGDGGIFRNQADTLYSRMTEASVDAAQAEYYLSQVHSNDFGSESDALAALHSVHVSLRDTAGPQFAREHLALVREFVDRYSLRYYVDNDAKFWVTFPGIAALVFNEIRRASSTHPHLRQELNAFEQCLAECLRKPTETRIKTTIQKHFNVLEAFGMQHPSVSANTFGAILSQVGTMPHDGLVDAGKDLYRFSCDYPGIRHAGTYEAAIRPLDLRDLASLALSLIGFIPYLSVHFATSIDAALAGTAASQVGQSPAPWE